MGCFICPVCRAPLSAQDRRFCCLHGHSYDRAKSGYINLLPPSGHGKRHGDDKLMLRARHDFLSRGYYDGFAARIAALCCEYLPEGGTLLDCGCGEGKYTLDVMRALAREGKRAELFGIDISKDAVNYAARLCPDAAFAAASCGAIPMADGSVSLLLNIFSPFTPGEYLRVLMPGGHLIRAYPLEEHLFELKALVYERPYKNTAEDMSAAGFDIVHEERLGGRIRVCGGDIRALFMMTPYYYKTGRDDQAKLDSVDALEVTLDFGVTVYRKK